jgi:hypothetical protein
VNSDDAGNHSPQWGKNAIASELMNMGTIDVHDARGKTVIDMRD